MIFQNEKKSGKNLRGIFLCCNFAAVKVSEGSSPMSTKVCSHCSSFYNANH